MYLIISIIKNWYLIINIIIIIPCRLSPQFLRHMIYHCHKVIVVITWKANIVFIITYMYYIKSCCLCKIRALCMSWITCDHVYMYVYVVKESKKQIKRQTMCSPGYYHFAHDIPELGHMQLHIAGTIDPKSAQKVKQGA